jgi:uncharacterized protein with FMN-binding domain
MPNLRSPQTLVAVALLASVALAACSPQKEAMTPSASPATVVTATGSPKAATDSAAAAADTQPAVWAKKGDVYNTTTSYMTPGGAQKVEFSVRVKDGVLTSVEVTPLAEDKSPISVKLQGQFKAAAQAALVGKKVADLTNVDRVGGASLTTDAFRKAIQQLNTAAL